MPVSEPPLVDAHFHVWRKDLPLTDTAWHRKVSDATIEQLIETLDSHGVTFGVVRVGQQHVAPREPRGQFGSRPLWISDGTVALLPPGLNCFQHHRLLVTLGRIIH